MNGIVHGHTITRNMNVPHTMVDEARKTLQYSDSWMGALRASQYRGLEILKRITIAASLLAAIWLLWEGSGVRDDTSVKPVQQHSPGIADRTAPLAFESSPTQINKPPSVDEEPGKLAETNQSQAKVPLASPSVASSVESTPLRIVLPARLSSFCRFEPLKE